MLVNLFFKMMDYYGDFPAPPLEQIVPEISKELYKEVPNYTKHSVVKKHIIQAIDDIGGHANLGSYTGYLVFGKKDVIQRSLLLLKQEKQLKYLKFKTFAKIVYTLIVIHNKITDERFKPGGEGYNESKKRFNDNLNSISSTSYIHISLPPINKSVPLYRPIKEEGVT